jgi:hypothetical protein
VSELTVVPVPVPAPPVSSSGFQVESSSRLPVRAPQALFTLEKNKRSRRLRTRMHGEYPVAGLLPSLRRNSMRDSARHCSHALTSDCTLSCRAASPDCLCYEFNRIIGGRAIRAVA